MLFHRKKKPIPYDKTGKYPVIRASICTGEQVAGFKDIHSGKFEEVMLIKNSRDLDVFKQLYQVEDISKEY